MGCSVLKLVEKPTLAVFDKLPLDFVNMNNIKCRCFRYFFKWVSHVPFRNVHGIAIGFIYTEVGWANCSNLGGLKKALFGEVT